MSMTGWISYCDATSAPESRETVARLLRSCDCALFPAPITGMPCKSEYESIRYCGVCVATLYATPCGLTQKLGAVVKLLDSETRALLATSDWVIPTSCAFVRSTVMFNCGWSY